MESRVELFARIRRDARVKGLSIRCLAREYRVSRRTVRQALAPAEPPERRTPAREAPKLGGDPACGKTRRTAAGRSADQLLKSFGIECRQTDTKSGKGAHITADQHHQPTVSSAKAPPSRGFPMCREPAVRGGVHRPSCRRPFPQKQGHKSTQRDDAVAVSPVKTRWVDAHRCLRASASRG